MKKVFIIHGWEGNSSNAWFSWLKNELEKRNFETIIPNMPNTDEPEIDSWVNKLKEIVGVPDRILILLGIALVVRR